MSRRLEIRKAWYVLVAVSASFLFITSYFLFCVNFWPAGLTQVVIARGYYAQALPNHILAELRRINIHALFGLALTILGFLQLLDRFRSRNRGLHKVLGLIYLTLGLACASYGVYLSQSSYGGIYTQSAVLAVASLWCFSALKGVLHLYRGNRMLHRRWMTRNYFATLSTVFVRPYYVLHHQLFPSHPPELVFPTAFWLTVLTAIALSEWYLGKTELRKIIPLQSTADGEPLRRTGS